MCRNPGGQARNRPVGGLERAAAAKPMQLQSGQFPIDCRTTELWKDGLPQGHPDRVQIQQPVLPQPAQQSCPIRRQGLGLALGTTGAVGHIGAPSPLRHSGDADAQGLGLHARGCATAANPLALVSWSPPSECALRSLSD